jgi:peptidoglycan/LPS O-acetylase OafA/YrhL
MQKIRAVQMLRGVAANMVVLNHIWGLEQIHYPTPYVLPACLEWSGRCGVYLFFIISGFVIVRASAREDWRQFIAARVTRIYPTYWFYTALLLVTFIAGRGLAENLAERSNVSLLASFALWPTAGGPLLNVGWTLIHEMYFYIVVAVMLAARLRPLRTLLLWAIVVVAAQPFSYNNTPLAAVLFSPLTLLFIFGAGLGLIVSASATTELRKPSFLERAAVLLGDASYSTYLSHLLILFAIWKASFILPWQTSRWVLFAVIVIAANVWGLLSYRFIEQPILRAVRRFKRTSSGTTTVPVVAPSLPHSWPNGSLLALGADTNEEVRVCAGPTVKRVFLDGNRSRA